MLGIQDLINSIAVSKPENESIFVYTAFLGPLQKTGLEQSPQLVLGNTLEVCAISLAFQGCGELLYRNLLFGIEGLKRNKITQSFQQIAFASFVILPY
jgi:hypothetical protein